jgi:hypothetical protein
MVGTTLRLKLSRVYTVLRRRLRSVSGVQPILAAMDVMAAHCDSYSLAASLTMRTARSMTSGEYFGCFFIAPFSQRMEPPQNPGRFKHLHIFILVDTHGKQVHSVLNPFDDCWLTMTCHQSGLNKPYVNGPQNSEIHGNNRYAQLPYLGPGNRATEQGIARLVDALDWLSYIYKARDKHEGDWEKEGQIFPASRPTRDRKSFATTIKHTPSRKTATEVRTGDDLLDRLIGGTQKVSSSDVSRVRSVEVTAPLEAA